MNKADIDKQVMVLIDDDEAFLDTLKRLLKDVPAELYTFNHPEKALAKIAELNPSLIVVDFEMPKLNGYQFMVKYSEKMLFHDRSVFLLTGADLDKDMKSAFPSLGIERFFHKPFDLMEFKTAVLEKFK